MPKIYILDPFYPTGVALAEQHAEVVRWDDPRVADWPLDADGLMVRMTRIVAADLERAQRLKVICKQGVGVDTIDLEAARARGVIVCRTPGLNAEAVAQLALTLGLDAMRRVTECDRLIRSGVRVERSKLLGLEAWGKTVGIVGMGDIGSRVARKWRGAFEAEIIAYDPYAPLDHWADLPHQRAASLAELLRASDLVSLHVPLSAETRHLIGRAELALMRETAVLVNTARGGIVDEAALAEALAGGLLFGAGLDVFETEPPSASDPLLRLQNLVATPHAGGGTRENQAQSSRAVAQQVLEVLAGRAPAARVV